MHSIGKKATPMVISRWILKQPHTTSTLLDRMEKKGLVCKIKDLESSNQVRIELTQKGEEARQKVMNDMAVKEILSVLSPEELAALRESLEKVFVKSLELFQSRKSATSKYYF